MILDYQSLIINSFVIQHEVKICLTAHITFVQLIQGCPLYRPKVLLSWYDTFNTDDRILVAEEFLSLWPLEYHPRKLLSMQKESARRLEIWSINLDEFIMRHDRSIEACMKFQQTSIFLIVWKLSKNKFENQFSQILEKNKIWNINFWDTVHVQTGFVAESDSPVTNSQRGDISRSLSTFSTTASIQASTWIWTNQLSH